MKTLLAILSVIPGLKATQPLPPRTVDTSSYRDFEVTLVEKYADGRENYPRGMCYKINLKNTGKGYLSSIGFTFEGGYYSYNTDIDGMVSNKQVIAPNQEVSMVISANYNAASLDEVEFHASAYTAFTDELEVSGSKILTSKQSYEEHYFNSIDMSFGHTERDEYCYGAVIKAYVDGKEAYFMADECDNFSFSSTKELEGNENDEVEVMGMFKTKYSHYVKENSNIFYNISRGCNGSILYGVPAAASLGLITTFVVALRRSIKKNKSK